VESHALESLAPYQSHREVARNAPEGQGRRGDYRDHPGFDRNFHTMSVAPA